MKQGRKRKVVRVDYAMPDPTQMANGEFHRELMAYRRTATIDTLLKASKIKPGEYEALRYYRDQALAAEDDGKDAGPLAPENALGGATGLSQRDLPVRWRWTPAIAETARIERDLGILRDIARAVAVDDLSLSQWCIGRHGGRERYDGKGRFVAMVPIGERRVMAMALMELRMAAGRIVR